MNPSLSPCPVCGKTLPEESPAGLCPACVLKRALEDADATPPSPELELPQLAAAFPHLVIEELIGQGGMGRVYRAKQPHLNRTVALKVLPDTHASDPEWTERFTREARALARLSHPHIVQVHDFGDNPRPFLLMEHVEGVNLRQAMETGGLSASEALAIAPKLCDALQYAHEQGVLHRDIKPENILIDTEGRVKLVDFGLAKLRDEGAIPFTLTQSGAKLGTLAYMAPEQIEKPADVDHRADIYSLGVVLYEMLTGELPLGRFPTPSEARGVDARLDAVVMRTLEKKQSRRPESAKQLRSELEQAQKAPAIAFSDHPANDGFIWKRSVAVAAGLVILLSLYFFQPFKQTRQHEIKDRASTASSPKPDANAQRITDWKRKQAEDQPLYDRSKTWVARAAQAPTREEQQQVLDEIMAALKSDQLPTIRAALFAVTGSYQLDFDRGPFRDQVRRHLATDDPDVRVAALRALSVCKPEASDKLRLLELAAFGTEDEIQPVAFALKTLSNGDFTGEFAKPILALLRRGMAAAERDRNASFGFDSRNILGVIWGASISPEIETQLIEWSRLDADSNDVMQVGNSSLGYNTFYHALSVHRNKTRAGMQRLLALAYHPDTTNVAGRCLWGLNGTVPNPHDQTYLVGEVLKLLELRHNDYLWRQGLQLIRLHAQQQHLPALETLSNRETLPPHHRDALTQIAVNVRAASKP